MQGFCVLILLLVSVQSTASVCDVKLQTITICY